MPKNTSDFVFLLFEDGGRPKPRYRLGFPQPEYQGSFAFEDVPSNEFKRTVPTARLLAASGERRAAMMWFRPCMRRNYFGAKMAKHV